MNDYLDNLVNRNLARGDVIKPRLPALFEPVSTVGPALRQDSSEIESAPDKQSETTQAPVGKASHAQLFSLTPPQSALQEIRRQAISTPTNEFQMETKATPVRLREVLLPYEGRAAERQLPQVIPTPHEESPQEQVSDAMPMIEPALPAQVEIAEKPHEAAPTIKITIGRVDVRAVMPAQQPKRPAAEPRRPSLSLDEYLKQREGGKR